MKLMIGFVSVVDDPTSQEFIVTRESGHPAEFLVQKGFKEFGTVDEGSKVQTSATRDTGAALN